MKLIIKVFSISIVISFIILFSPLFYREFRIKMIKFDFSKNVSIPDFSIRTLRDTTRSINIAENSLKNIYEFQTQTSSFPPIKCDIDNIWQNKEILSNTHDLYIHSLYILWDLINAHKSSNNDIYLERGLDIIASWLSENHRWDPLASQYVWWDHSTSERTIAILTFTNYCKDFINLDDVFIRKLNNYSNYATRYLINPQNYIYEHNHGIFEDIALLLLSEFIEDSSYATKFSNLAIDRFYNQVHHSFSEQGIHLENSPGYHLVVTNLCDYFIQLSAVSHRLSPEIVKIIKKARFNEGLFKTPIGMLAEIGDTNWLENIDCIPDLDNFQVADSLAGYYINKFNNQYLFARTQGILRTHAHNDVLSFIYSTSDGSIISETGFLNYTSSYDKEYSKSINGHNSIILNTDIKTNGFIRKFGQSENWAFVLLEGLSGNLSFSRSIFLNKKKKELLLVDKANEHESDWIQLIHLSHKITNIDVINDSSINVKLPNNSLYRITSNNPFKIIKGQQTPKKMGWKAIPFEKLIPSFVITKANSQNDTISFFHIQKINDSATITLKKSAIDKFDRIIENISLYQKANSIYQKKKPNWGTQYFRRVQVFKYYLICFFISFLMISLISKFIKNNKLLTTLSLLPNFFLIVAILYVVVRHIN